MVIKDQVTYNATPEPRPVLRSRIISMPLSQSSVGSPHHSVELEKLFKEARFFIIDSLCVHRHCNDMSERSQTNIWGLTLSMLVGFNVPQRVLPSRVLVTGHLLLLVTPVRQLDFV